MKTTKRTLTALAMVALMAPAMESCKKGEEDPTISMKSRDGRVTNEWVLTSMESTSTNNDTETSTDDGTEGTQVTTKQTFDGSNLTTTTTTIYLNGDAPSNSSTVTTVNNWTKNLVIGKDSKYTNTETSSPVSTTKTSSPSQNCGDFDTAGWDCDGTYTYVLPTTTTSTETEKWNWIDSKKNKSSILINNTIYDVYKLSSKELILKRVESTSSNTPAGTGTTSYTSDWSVDETLTFTVK